MSTSPEPRKIGEGHADAMFRQGFKELRNSLYPESNVAGHPELGLYGTQTPGEISESRRPDEHNPEIERWEQEGGASLRKELSEGSPSIEPAPSREPEREVERE